MLLLFRLVWYSGLNGHKAGNVQCASMLFALCCWCDVSETGKGLAAVWFKFFLDAGVPASDAGNYAVKFTEHRIQPDMLSDLTKEYLNDMGITLLGDVIVILKHARMEHAKVWQYAAKLYQLLL